MKFKGIIFDVNGTLIDILTDEGLEEIYRSISHFLTFHDIYLHRWELRDEYLAIIRKQRDASKEDYPEFDAVKTWREFLKRHEHPKRPISRNRMKHLPLYLAQMYRGISRHRLELYPDVLSTLNELKSRYKLAALSDAQSAWAAPEIRQVGLDSFFNPLVVSGDFGFRKPDPRLFRVALKGLNLTPDEALFVGNDMYRDIFGAQEIGLKTVFFKSNQGRQSKEGVEPDYIIYRFGELLQAVEFLEQN
jgi:putative hydrolase of the HAD superfamily